MLALFVDTIKFAHVRRLSLNETNSSPSFKQFDNTYKHFLGL